MFLVTAPWTHNANPPHLGSIHSLSLSTLNIILHREPPAQSLHVQCLPPEAPITSAAVVHLRLALPSLLSKDYDARKGTRLRVASRTLHNPPSLFLQLALLPANTLAWEHEQKTTLTPPAYQRCLVLCWRTCDANLWATILDHFVWPAQPFQIDNIIWMTSLGSAAYCCWVLSSDLLLQACKLSWPCHELTHSLITPNDFSSYHHSYTYSKSWLEKILQK